MLESANHRTTTSEIKERKRPNYLWRRAAAFVIALSAATGGVVGVYKSFEDMFKARREVKESELTNTYIVKSGDTAWNIAEERTPDNRDVRPLVDKIMKQTNNDGTPGLQPGDTVLVPPTTEPEHKQ